MNEMNSKTSKTQIVNDSNFDDKVLQSKRPVLVDFWAPWCGPCQAIKPILHEIAEELGDQLSVVTLNIDENPLIPVKYAVRGIPTLLLFEHGKLLSTHVGSLTNSKLKEFLKKHLKQLKSS